ncbi:MAG: ABC transporter permease subunit [Acidobacteriota bacterium]
MPNSLHQIGAIAKNTFREAIRDRILYNLVVFVLLITACAILLGDLTGGQEARTIVNIGLNALLFFGVFIAIFVGVGLVSKELEKRTVYAMFAKPVRRGDFIIGKYLGLCLTLSVNVLVMGAGVSLALLWVKAFGLAASIWPAVFLIFLELCIITSVSILFSSFSSPALSALLTFLVFVIGHLSSSLRELAAGLGSPAAAYFFDLIYYLLPNLAHFSFRSEAAVGLEPSMAMIASAVVYGLIYVVIMLVLTITVFNRRNFK